MADEQAKKAPAESKGSAASSVLGMLLPAVLAAASAFGGAKLGAGSAAPHAPEASASETPGPTEMLDPFLVTVADPQRAHVIKMTIAIELKRGTSPEHFKPFVARVRDAILGYLRSLTFDEASNPARFEQMRTDLLERLVKLGVHDAEHILITEFVAQ